MGGWTIGYGLLNFSILAAALFLLGRRLLPKLIRERRARIERAI